MSSPAPVSGRLVGTAVSLAGVVLVRVVSPHLMGASARWVAVLGYVIVTVGLFLFARAISQRAELRSNGEAHRR